MRARLALLVCLALASAGTVSTRTTMAAESSAPPPTRFIPMPVAAPGLQLGAHLGFAWPTGRLSAGNTYLSDLETGIVPVGLDVGYRFSPRLYLGGTLEWSPGVAPNAQSTCPGSASCFRQEAQLRVDARLYLKPEARTSWWLGAGAGYEIASFAQSFQGSTVTATFTGPVLFDARIGFDTRGQPRGVWSLGPYFGVSWAEFVTEGVNPAAAPVSLGSPSIHTWITLGLRGTYGPW